MIYKLNTSDKSQNAIIEGFAPDTKLQSSVKKIAIGQDHAIDCIMAFIQEFNAGFREDDKPAGSFLLLGPTGVGKTETVKAIAKVLHGSEKLMIRIDCAEFQHSHEIARILGSPPGYIGHEQKTGLITEKSLMDIKSSKCNLSIILFDEIEKAHDSVQRLLLGILDNGRLTLGTNVIVDMSQTIIFLTSNLGTKETNSNVDNKFGIGSGQKVDHQSKEVKNKTKSVVLASAVKHFSSEFLNRLSATVVFNKLDKESYSKIINKSLDLFTLKFFKATNKVINIYYTRPSKDKLIELGSSDTYGARELNRVLKNIVTSPIVKLFMGGKIPDNARIEILYNDDFEIDVKNN